MESQGAAMVSLEIRSKHFYRKLEALLEAVQAGRGDGAWIRQLHAGMTRSFGDLLHVRGGRILVDHGGYYVEDTEEPAAASVGFGDPAVQLVHEHGVCLFQATVGATECLGRRATAAFAVGSEPLRILTFDLAAGWNADELEFALRTFRSALDHRLQSERMHSHLEQAFEIQKSLLPARLPLLSGWEFAAFYSPAERVGGDFYDFLAEDSEALTWVVGDASGHGLGAALLARDVVTGLRMGADREIKLTVLVERLGRVIARSLLSTRFTSLFIAELEREGNLFYVNAGHPPPWHVSADGITRLTEGGAVLGPMAPGRYRRGFARLAPGDLLLAPTDGLLERADRTGAFLADDGVESLLRDCRGLSASVVSARLQEAAERFGPSGDDTTWLVIRRQP